MPNTDTEDNQLTPRTIVAGSTAAHWVGASLVSPDNTRYVRGTVELREGSSSEPAVGIIESCDFSETGEMEKLSDGACGIEAYDQYELGWKVEVTARFRKGDDPPRKGEVFSLMMPEGNQPTNLRLRFVCTDGGRSWSERGLRKCKFSGEITNNLIKAALVAARIAGTVGAEVETSASYGAPGGSEFGDDLGVSSAATGLLTSNGTNVTDADTVTIGSTVYRFKTVMAAAYDVQLGTTAANTLANLKAAINLTGVAGTNYHASTLIHPTVTAGALTSTTLAATAKAAGTAGNSIATTDVAATLSWGAATLTGGTA